MDVKLNFNLTSQCSSIEELSSVQKSHKNFSALHMNICSLSSDYDEFHDHLASLKVILLTTNIYLPGYKFFYTPSHSVAGCFAIYIKCNLSAGKREGLSFSNSEFETIWIEIENAEAKKYHSVPII